MDEKLTEEAHRCNQSAESQPDFGSRETSRSSGAETSRDGSATRSLDKSQWARLRRLRRNFLEGVTGEYWRDAEDVRLYDEVFARRIEWKWSDVLEQLETAGWKPRSRVIVDWGCGSGRISRFLAANFPCDHVFVHDQSRIAMRFAEAAHHEAGLPVTSGLPAPRSDEGFLLVVSHVLNELTESSRQQLLGLAGCADEILWVEPGDRESSLRLSAVRDQLIDANFQIVAPCTHANRCPMIQSQGHSHWCHFFGRPPVEVFQSAFWREVGERLEIDMRSLPFSFLAASKAIGGKEAASKSEVLFRSIGAPRLRKGFVEVLGCGEGGLKELRVTKRRSPEKFRDLKKSRRTFVLASSTL